MRNALGDTTEPRRAPRRATLGFTMIELLVTVLIAGIIFLAMTPLFITVLKTTSTNSRRVIATNLGQATTRSCAHAGL